jgi:hypothetical protein
MSEIDILVEALGAALRVGDEAMAQSLIARIKAKLDRR